MKEDKIKEIAETLNVRLMQRDGDPIEKIESAITKALNSQWIDASESHPEEHGEYLCDTGDWNNYQVADYIGNGTWISKEFPEPGKTWEEVTEHIIRWMPIPKPSEQ